MPFMSTMKFATSLFMAALFLPTVLGVYHPTTVNFFTFGTSEGDQVLNQGDEAGALVSLQGADFVFYSERYRRIVVS